MTGLVWLALLAIAVLGFVTASKMDDGSCGMRGFAGFISYIVAWAAAVVLFIGLVAWPFAWIENKSFEAEVRAVQETVTATRETDETVLERVALTQKVVDMNRELGPLKYWNGTVLDWYIPDGLAKLDLIK